MRASLDYDSQSVTAEKWSDTNLPLNLNDEDIWPEMTHVPQARTEFTPMTFSLVRWELAATFLRFGKVSTNLGTIDEAEIRAQEEMLAEVRQRLEDRYLKFCRSESFDTHPMEWSSVLLTRIVRHFWNSSILCVANVCSSSIACGSSSIITSSSAHSK